MVCASGRLFREMQQSWRRVDLLAPVGKGEADLIGCLRSTKPLRGSMKLLTLALVVFLMFALSSAADESDRKHIIMKRAAEMKLPFSDGVLVGNTLYVAGHLGLDPKTGKPPSSTEEEAKLALDGIKEVVESAGMTMDDLVSVQVFCSDLSLYETFNNVYRTFFHEPYPARAFLGSGPLLRGAKFEVMGIAVKRATK